LLFILAGLIVSAGLGSEPAQGQGKQKTDPKAKADQKGPPPGLTFEVYKDASDKFRWRLRDADGTNIGMAPRGYDTKADCTKVIDEIKSGAARAKVEDQ
jgi:uncharacterized protein YegP (UPF0339 family)